MIQLRRVWLTDQRMPLNCHRWPGPMWIIPPIEQLGVIEKNLSHLRWWPVHVHSPPVESVAA